jgi:hypothetical protein
MRDPGLQLLLLILLKLLLLLLCLMPLANAPPIYPAQLLVPPQLIQYPPVALLPNRFPYPILQCYEQKIIVMSKCFAVQPKKRDLTVPRRKQLLKSVVKPDVAPPLCGQHRQHRHDPARPMPSLSKFGRLHQAFLASLS